MTSTQRLYQVLKDHREIEADDLARLAEVNRKHLSSTVCKARKYCRHGFTIEGFTTRTKGVTQTFYKVVRDYGVYIGQRELNVA